MISMDEEHQKTEEQHVPTPEESVKEGVKANERQYAFVSNIPVLPQLGVALGILVLIFGISYIGASGSVSQNPTEDVYIESTIETEEGGEKEPFQNVFDDIALEAKSAVVWDVKNERLLFNKNADVTLPLASVTKLMTALVAYELLDPEDTVAVSQEAIRTEGDSGLRDGETFTVRDLTDLILITSSNDGAAALSQAAGTRVEAHSNPEEIFVRAMNVKAKELGLSKTEFKNSTGLDISKTEAGAYGSARDMAQLMAYIITNAHDAIALTNTDTTRITNQEGAYHIAQNTNELVNNIDGLIASKTGYTELAGGNLVVAFNAGLNRPIVVAVLGSSYQGRFSDTHDLIARTRALITQE